MKHDIYSERERAFEMQFACEQTQNFRVHARRDKLLGHWAALHMGLSAHEADAYALEIAVGDVEHPGDRDIITRIMHDLARHGRPLPRETLEHELHHLEAVARCQLDAENAA